MCMFTPSAPKAPPAPAPPPPPPNDAPRAPILGDDRLARDGEQEAARRRRLGRADLRIPLSGPGLGAPNG